MAKIRRIIQTVPKTAQSGFDEQYWPVLIAFAVLFGSMMGTALTLLSGIWLWFSMLAIPVFIFSTTIALKFVDNRTIKRSTQLAIIVSLIVHFMMMLSAHHWDLFGNETEANDTTNDTKRAERREPVPVAFETQRWHETQSQITPQPVEQPVEKKETEREREVEPEKQPTPVDKSERKVVQNQTQRKNVAQTVPRQSQTLSKLSRSNLKSSVKSGTRVSEVKNNSSANNPARNTERSATLTANEKSQVKPATTSKSQTQPREIQTESRKSQASQSTVQRRQATPTESTTSAKNPSRSRRNRNQPVPNPLQSVVRNDRSRSNPTPTPSKVPTPSQSQQTLAPQSTSVAKASPNRQADQPTQQAPDQSNAQRQTLQSPIATRRPTNESNPEIAQSPTRPTRSTQSQQVPNRTTVESTTLTVQAPRESSTINPRATSANISRQQKVSPQQTQIQIEAPTQQMSAVSQSATKASRRPNNSLPSINPNASPSTQPRRTSTNSAQVASNTTAESPSQSTSQSRVATSQGQPRNTTLQRSTNGTAGAGQSQNLLSESPASTKPSMVASDSAVRREATRNTPADSAFQPVQSAQTRRSLTDRSSPSTSMPVENSSIASTSGSRTPAKLNAQSSAAQINAASNARSDRVNAAQGSSTLDTGATKLVSESAQGRASGGGQPDVDSEIRTSANNSSRNGQTTNHSLAANLQADVPTAPKTDGGGRPSETTPDPNASSLAKTVAGGGPQATAGPTSATIEGMMEESSSAPTQSPSTLARTSPTESAMGDPAQGGGDPDSVADPRRTRRQLAGNNANTKVTFSGENYTSRKEGSDGTDGSPASKLVGGSNATIESQSTGNSSSVGSGNPANVSAGQEKASGGQIAASNLSRQSGGAGDGQPSENAGVVASGRSRSAASGPPSNTVVELTDGSPGSGAEPGAGASPSKLAGQVGTGMEGLKRRESTGGQQVQLDLQEGPGGLGEKVASSTGIRSRRARADSSSIQLNLNTRFTRKDAGGDPKINTNAVFSKGAFKGRDMAKNGGGAPSTEPSIELGLAWLAKRQRAPGNWNLRGNGDPKFEHLIDFDAPTAATGLALLAFQGAGYNHKEYRYADQVNRGIQWLINNQKDDGDLYVETDTRSNKVCRLYSHGIATIALCEAYGMTNDPDVKQAAQKALNFISDSQDKTLGGWRYTVGRDADTSVTGWMVMAIKSGKLAGLEVDKRTTDLVNRWLGIAVDSRAPYRFRYNPNDVNTAQYPDREIKGKTPTPAMSAVGLLLKLYSGWNRNDPRMIQGANELLKQMPSENSIIERDTYYWYYATQVLRHVGGDAWKKWYPDNLYPLLIRTQEKSGPMQGSWDPINPVADRWGAKTGRLYMTTMNLLTLEVKWRLLPLYEDTVK